MLRTCVRATVQDRINRTIAALKRCEIEGKRNAK
jgi:hypothetical protein